ncbi:hypothetical protein PV05_06154 [Exophiala xenobiotica]|uniref:Uncharacterized protein n=1 Tax=Exophiala xenobiotica TaxID=348802 RepID=A0A0D2ESA4_9EURO|nr:uncharacterized protein PV05_06154 [Exophiala xenobiotica]KIW57615.1 hypothetical protein PV05_06154 [Exophiala xenobiotica]
MSDVDARIQGIEDTLKKLLIIVEEDYFDELITHPCGIARLLCYKSNPTPENAQEKSEEQLEQEEKLGLGAHTDYECFTLLLNSANPGLEILLPTRLRNS